MVTGLVLQGGGALGAFELGVIEWLLEHRGVPDIVSGVSIGAINATVLAGSKRADPREELRGLWTDLTTAALPPPLDVANADVSLFGNPGLYTPRMDYLNFWHWTSFYETAAAAVDTGKAREFRQAEAGEFHRQRPSNGRPS